MKKQFTISMLLGSALIVTAPVVMADAGQAAYMKYCQMCHGSGAAGAPKTGNKHDWTARIEKGMDVLKENAIKGFRGPRGYMPPKGGYPKLADDDVSAAVVYMVDASK